LIKKKNYKRWIKLHKELLVGNNPYKIYHKKNKKIQDLQIPFNQLKINLNNLTNLLSENKVTEVKNILERLIQSYKFSSKIIDHIYEEQLSQNKFNFLLISQ
jgi:hypothetical protein